MLLRKFIYFMLFLVWINIPVHAELVYGTSARAQFEEFRSRLGDSYLDFENLAAKSNITTEISGLTFKTTEDRAFQNNNAIDTGVNVICSSASPFSSSCDNEDHQIAGVREGNTTDGQSLYEIHFSQPQRRVGLERNWNTFSLTHFYSGNSLLATHQNTQNSEFVGYISESANITRVVIDGIATDVSDTYPRGIYQTGYSDDLFYGASAEDGSGDAETITIVADQGDAIIATTTSADTTHTSVPSVSAIVTDGDDEISLVDEDNTQVTIKPNTLVSQHPKQVVDNQTTKKTTLLRGTLELLVPVTTARDYLVSTAIADILIADSDDNRKANGLTQLTLQYSQEANNGSLNINVSSGSVVVTDRDGVKQTITAGQEVTLNGAVRRSSWVLPIDGGFIQSGVENTLAWLAYPNAAGYLLEYNFPTPKFAEDNPSQPEFSQQSLFFYPGQYSLWQDLVILPLVIPDLPGVLVEARIFPINANGQVINQSKASDTGSYTFQ